MKITVIFIFTMVLFGGLFSCESDSVWALDEITTKSYSFSGYTAIDVSHNFKVYVKFSETEEKVEIKANDNLHQYIDLDVVGNTLKIGVNDLRNVRGSEVLNVYITTNKIIEFIASGNAHFIIEDAINSQNIRINLSGTSSLSGNVELDEMEVALSGISKVNLEGNVKNLEANVAGKSELSGYGLTTKNLKIILSGISSAYLTIDQSIDVEANGKGVLWYKGDANIVHQNLTSEAKIIKK